MTVDHQLGFDDVSERSHAFRPDIQALRALAVGLVLVWHAGVPGLPAGFIGVDIFFVVSGFLITGLLLAERGEWGSISLRGFYARRARRLLPAATIVTIATLVATVLIMPSLRQESIALDGLASTFYVENWRLADQAVDYQAAQVATSPFQHYWSLSVEEQFYLVWPVLLLLVLSGNRGFFRSGRYRARLLAVLGVVFAASLGYSIWDSYTSPDPAYFVTVNRVWQFAAGGILAAVEVGIGQLRRRSIALPLAGVGLASLIAGALLIDPASPYPGLAALVPTLGTVALLAGGTVAVTTTIGRHLTSRPVLRVGDLSYSLYLWHWPMLVFAAELFGPLSAVEGLAVVALAFVPSIATERLIERPIRLGPRFAPWRAGLALGGVLMLASTVVAVGVAPQRPDPAGPRRGQPLRPGHRRAGRPRGGGRERRARADGRRRPRGPDGHLGAGGHHRQLGPAPGLRCRDAPRRRRRPPARPGRALRVRGDLPQPRHGVHLAALRVPHLGGVERDRPGLQPRRRPVGPADRPRRGLPRPPVGPRRPGGGGPATTGRCRTT